MCLLVVARHVHPDYPLIIAANRDEMLDRRSAPMAQWDASDLEAGLVATAPMPLEGRLRVPIDGIELPEEYHGAPLLTTTDRVTAGRDLDAGGTWLAAATGGRFGAVTNVREPGVAEAPLSRGQLPLWALADRVPQSLEAFGPVNLVWGDADSMMFVSNRGAYGRERIEVGEGMHTLSNASLDTPWPKSRFVAAGISEALWHWQGPTTADAEAAAEAADAYAAVRTEATEQRHNGAGAATGTSSDADGEADAAAHDQGPRPIGDTPQWAAQILEPMLSRKRAPLNSLPRTGLGIVDEWFLSSPFVRRPGYGTRSQTAMVVDKHGVTHMVERRFDTAGRLSGVVAGSLG